MQDQPESIEPISEQQKPDPSFSDEKVRGVLADESDSPAVVEVRERTKRPVRKIQWLKIAKVGAVATGIPCMIGLIGFGFFNYFYPQKVLDFLSRAKSPSQPFVIKSRQRLPHLIGDEQVKSKFLQAEKLITQGENLKAQALFSELLKTGILNSSQQSQAWRRLGELYAADDRIDEANNAYQQSIMADPSKYKNYVDYAVFLRDQGDLEAAMEYVLKALGRNPNEVTANNLKKELQGRLASEKE